MFNKIFNKKKKVKADESHLSKQVDRLLSFSLYRESWAGFEYNLFNDSDVLLTLSSIVQKDGLLENQLNGLPILNIHDFRHFTHIQELNFIDGLTIEEARSTWGMGSIKCLVSGYRKGSQWERLFESLSERGETIEFLLEESKENKITVYCKIEEGDPLDSSQNNKATWQLVNPSHNKLCLDYFENNKRNFYEDDFILNERYKVISGLFSKAINQGTEIVGFYSQSNEHSAYFFNNVQHDFKSPLFVHPFWKDFDWSKIENKSRFDATCREYSDSDMPVAGVYHYMAHNLTAAVHEANKVQSEVISSYPKEGYFKKVFNSIEEKKVKFNDFIQELSTDKAMIENTFMNSYLSLDGLLKFLPNVTAESDDAAEQNNKAEALISLSCELIGETNEQLNKYHKRTADLCEKMSAYPPSSYYSYMLIKFMDYLHKIDRKLNELPLITYTKPWSLLSKKEKVAVQVIFYYLIVLEGQERLCSYSISDMHKALFSIIFNNGSTERNYLSIELFTSTEYKQLMSEFYCAIDSALKENCEQPEAASNAVISIAQDLVKKDINSNITKDLSLILGVNQLGTQEKSSTLSNDSRNPLSLGFSDKNELYEYSGEGSIITIAPPRSGKSRFQVIPNLMKTKSSAFVIDPKGECFERTSESRMQIASGKVYKFAPFSDDTDHFNPLEFVSKNSLWDDSKFISNLVIEKEQNSSSNSEFFRDLAVDYLAACIVSLKTKEDRDCNVCFNDVGDMLLESRLDELLEYAASNRQAAKTLLRIKDLPNETRQGVFSTAQRAISCWEDDAIFKSTSGSSDWDPSSIKLEGTSIYICFPPAAIEQFASVIRVITSLHIREVLRDLPEYGEEPDVVFFMDELPLLGYMKPVEDAVYVGAQYGIRAWLFVQSIGQLKKHYENADGLIGACNTRCFMNPSQYEQIAKKVSEGFGTQEDIISGQQKAIITEHEVASEKYKDKIFVFSNEKNPLIIDKFV